jgi:hypothetical protein
MTRLIISLSVFAILAAGVGVLLSGDDDFDWAVALTLFGIAAAGEGARVWLRRNRAKIGRNDGSGKDSASQSSGI